MSKIKSPHNKIKNSLVERIKKNREETIHLDEVPEPDFDMTYRNISPELIKYFTMSIRRTPEFRSFISFLKNYLDVSKCSYYEDYSMKNGFIIELHHHPFSLFDICEAVAKRRLEENGYIETYIILEEVMLLHYQFMVGLTPLNPTAHDLAHNDDLEIHPNLILGEWKNLYKDYFPYLSPNAIRKYDKLIVLEKEKLLFPEILKIKPLTLDVNGMTQIIDERKFENLIIEKKIRDVDKLSYQG
jgi:hypothetical protein